MASQDDDADYDLFGSTHNAGLRIDLSNDTNEVDPTPSTSVLQVEEDLHTLFPLPPEPLAVCIPVAAPTSIDSDKSDVSSGSYKTCGNAVDIIAIKSQAGDFFTTSWHVAFSWSRFKSNLAAGVGDYVNVFVNGWELRTRMSLLERGRCVFETGGLTPPIDDLRHVSIRDTEANLVRFEHHQRATGTMRFVESRIYVWNPNDSVVVADLDGTLTISDVEGHIRTLRLGQYDFLHKGACEFFTKLHELELRILYLTARPIDWAGGSRVHLDNAKQHLCDLPAGPLITNSNGLKSALLTEVVNRNPHVFKAQVLNEIQLCMIHAGRDSNYPVFVAGFGNRLTDVCAYEEVGMEKSLIFLIDPYSNLRASNDTRVYESYDDPNALLWLLPRLKHKVPMGLVERIDAYTMRELVLADEREQLRLTEQLARRLQEEEISASRSMSRSASGSSSISKVAQP